MLVAVRFRPIVGLGFLPTFGPLRPVGGAHTPALRVEALGERSRGRLKEWLLPVVSPFNPRAAFGSVIGNSEPKNRKSLGGHLIIFRAQPQKSHALVMH